MPCHWPTCTMGQCAQRCHIARVGERINDLKLILGRVAEVSKLLQWHTALHPAHLTHVGR